LETRPTGGKVREAIFNIQADAIAGARVLDLFAGTGAFGLEALSRGAERAVFIELNDPAITAIKKNIRTCGMESRAQCFKWDISRDLNCIRSFQPGFDMVFMDPPYYGDLIAAALKNLENCMCLQNRAVIIIEHGNKTAFPELYPPFYLADHRRYGKSLVTFLDYVLGEPL
jgi:16S rRNA (guanine966-N2)-methyltransferase